MIERALRYAEQKHGLSRRRDGLTIEHVRDVVYNLQSLGVQDPYSVCAAWLHDTIEDTDADYDEISKKFGGTVAEMVSSLSKDTRLPREERAAEYAKRLSRASPAAKTVKLADVMANLASISESGTDAPKFRRKATALRAFLVAIRGGISAELPGLSAAQERIDAMLGMHGLDPVRLDTA